jgi:hypothetical protein
MPPLVETAESQLLTFTKQVLLSTFDNLDIIMAVEKGREETKTTPTLQQEPAAPSGAPTPLSPTLASECKNMCTTSLTNGSVYYFAHIKIDDNGGVGDVEYDKDYEGILNSTASP